MDYGIPSEQTPHEVCLDMAKSPSFCGHPLHPPEYQHVRPHNGIFTDSLR